MSINPADLDDYEGLLIKLREGKPIMPPEMSLLGRLGAVAKATVPPHIGVNYQLVLSDGLKAQTVSLYEPDGGDINAITDEVLALAIRDAMAKLEAM